MPPFKHCSRRQHREYRQHTKRRRGHERTRKDQTKVANSKRKREKRERHHSPLARALPLPEKGKRPRRIILHPNMLGMRVVIIRGTMVPISRPESAHPSITAMLVQQRMRHLNKLTTMVHTCPKRNEIAGNDNDTERTWQHDEKLVKTQRCNHHTPRCHGN